VSLPYSEPELIAPALDVIASSKSGVSTTALIGQLRAALRPSGHDGAIISNRSDDYFSQKVRNLVSHKTLEELRL